MGRREGFVCARRAAPAADRPLGPVSCACVPTVPVWDVCSVRRRPAGISESRLTFPVKQPPLRGLRCPASDAPQPDLSVEVRPTPARADQTLGPRAENDCESLRNNWRSSLERNCGESDTDQMAPGDRMAGAAVTGQSAGDLPRAIQNPALRVRAYTAHVHATARLDGTSVAL